jgi:transposase-like protein
MKQKEIAETFGVSHSTVRRRQKVRRHRKYSQAEKDDAVAMLKDYTPSEVARILDIPRSNIVSWRDSGTELLP